MIILTRAAQWFAFGLVVGLVLRWAVGRRLFPVVVVVAHVPFALFIWFEASQGRFARLATWVTPAFVAGSLIILVGGLLLGLVLARRRAWLVPLVPLLSGAAFMFLPLTQYEAQLARAAVEQDMLPASAYAFLAFALTMPFSIAMLTAFAPRRLRFVDRGVREAAEERPSRST